MDFSISSILNQIAGRFTGLFDSTLEMTFYVFALIALHMILAHLFYGKPSRRRVRSLNFKRSFLIFFLVAEIIVFTNLLTVDHMTQNMHKYDAFNERHVHSYKK